MIDIEFRDSIAKELFIETMFKQSIPNNNTVKYYAKICFERADIFMEEKLSRTQRMATQRNFIGNAD